MNKVNVRSIFKSNEIYLIIIVIIISTIIGSINRSFLSIENLFDLLRSGSIIGVMSIGFLIVLISGGIDVSFAAVATVSMYVTVSILNKFGGNIYVALIISSVLGIALGAINASFISYFQIPTLIATLGTMNIFHASLLVIGKTAHISKIPEAIVDFGKGMIVSWTNSDGKTIGLSFLSFVMIVIFFLTWLILKYTMLGRGIYAIGGNFDAAKRLGLNVGKIQLFIYCYMGFVAGIAGLLNVSLVRYVNSFDLVGTEITVIAAVALGGAAIAGGKGSVFGTVLGVTLIVILKNSLVLMGIPSTWDYVIIGLVILFSISLTTYQQKRGKLEFNKL